jgi:catalase
VEPPGEGQAAPVSKRAPEVGVEARKRTDSIRTRKMAILAADGYDHDALMQVKEALEKKGAPRVTASFPWQAASRWPTGSRERWG